MLNQNGTAKRMACVYEGLGGWLPYRPAERMLFWVLCCFLFTGTVMADNRLRDATSPYLLQHAQNPVDWYPWGTEALERAKKEQKLIFLSIGYAACHWCHVMERESFTDPKTAALLNAHYISIKVDREERPDLDGHFMEILTTFTESGGWPLNMILTPTLQPVYGGTYFPPTPAHGKPGFRSMLVFLHNEWQEDRAMVLERSKQFGILPNVDLPLPTDQSQEQPKDPATEAALFWRERFDKTHGGIGEGVKFPQPAILSLLLRQSVNAQRFALADPALKTLDHMAAGGVRDQLGGAFHRYAVDRRWQIPHFEIMLYDNALLARVYLEAFQLTGQAHYALIVREILDDLLARFREPGGCFISSLDADSEGEEGLFYTWTEEEIVAVLGRAQATPFMELFFDPLEGLVAGRSVLRFMEDTHTLPKVRADLRKTRRALLTARDRRPPPARDDKILTSWNALTLSALARAGAVLGEEKYIQAAQECLEDLTRHSGGEAAHQLRHSRRGNRLSPQVFLDDYAFLTQALLDLYETTFDLRLLQKARTLANVMLDRFQPASGQPFQLTPRAQTSAIPVRTVLEDGVTPAGNSVALVSLQRLARLSEDARFKKEAGSIRQQLAVRLQKQWATSPELLHAWDYEPDRMLEVIVVGQRHHPETQSLLQEVRRRLIPGLVLVFINPDHTVDAQAWPLLSGRRALQGKPTAYVCGTRFCRIPVHHAKALAGQLDAWGKSL